MRRYIFGYISIMALAMGLIFIDTAAAGTIKGMVKPMGLRSAANILVYVVRAPKVAVNLSGTKFVMDQQRLTFIPHMLPVLVGSTVLFPNNDKVAHNVFSLSRAKKFNLGSYKPGERRTVVFDRAGVVELRCDVHQEMRAYIMVLRNPYFAVTGPDGSFTIPDTAYLNRLGINGVPGLPAGTYLVKTWHEKLGASLATVTVPATGQVTVVLKPRRGAPGVLYKR